MTEITPEPANGFDYASAPPPIQYYPTPAPKRRGLPWWGWMLIGVGVLLVMGVVASGVAVYLHQQSLATEYSPNYTGTPIEASDAVGDVVVSQSGAVAYTKGQGWVEGADYFDLSSMTAGLQAGQSIVGVHFTVDPDSADLNSSPQLVMILESASEENLRGDMNDAIEGYLGGMRGSGAEFDDPHVVEYSTANGLEGYSAEFQPVISGVATDARVVVVARGERAVFVQWISYDGPMDGQAMDQLLESLRIDE